MIYSIHFFTLFFSSRRNFFVVCIWLKWKRGEKRMRMWAVLTISSLHSWTINFVAEGNGKERARLAFTYSPYWSKIHSSLERSFMYITFSYPILALSHHFFIQSFCFMVLWGHIFSFQKSCETYTGPEK